MTLTAHAVTSTMDRHYNGGALNSGQTELSGSRMPMLKNQIAQHLPLLNSDVRQCMVGTELDHSRTVWKIQTSSDCRIRVLHRLKKHLQDGELIRSDETVSDVIVYEEVPAVGVGRIGVIEVPYYISNHTIFGYKLVRNENFDDIQPGVTLPAQTVLAHGPSAKANGDWGVGKEMNVSYLSLFGTNEDGAIGNIETMTKGFESEVYTKTKIFLGLNETLLNIHGTFDYTKPLPSVGDVIRGSGLVAATREITNDNAPVALLKRNLMHPQKPFDKEYYNPLDSLVVDVRVIKANKAKDKSFSAPRVMLNYLDKLVQQQENYYDRILAIYKSLPKDRERHPSWQILLVEVFKREKQLREKGLTTPNAMIDNMPINGYYIEIVTRHINRPQLGHKFSDMNGAKFVLCQLKPAAEMPTDKWGRVADLIFNPTGILNRNNPSQLNEPYANDVMFHARNKLNAERKAGATDAHMVERLMGFYKTISKQTYTSVMENTNDAEKIAHMKHVLSPGQMIRRTDEFGGDDMGLNAVGNVFDTEWRAPRGKVTFRDGGGNWVTSKADVRVAPKTIFAMEKICSYVSAVALPLRQHLGFVAKLNSLTKKYTQINAQGSRAIGETESRGLFAYINNFVVKALQNFSSNPMMGKAFVEAVLQGKQGLVDIEGLEDYQPRGLAILRHEMNCFGLDFTSGVVEECE